MAPPTRAGRRKINNAVANRAVGLGLSRRHAAILARLRSPERIQDFVSTLHFNFEPGGSTCLSVAGVLDERRAHCIEAAFVAACALWVNGHAPLLMDMQAEGDDDHVIALFKYGNCWGAISKSNHIWLRWRDPIYRSLRELVMSYFHEYVLGASKTLRRYSRPFDLRRFGPEEWVTNTDDCWDVAVALDDQPHYPILTPAQARQLRRRDTVETKANNMIQFRSRTLKIRRRQ